ncbi:MAG: ABC transporter ATP-binding protein [Beutenbergiaceae bacterium]
MNEPIITATNLRRTYTSAGPAFEAVRGIDLAVNRGEVFALLGTNGAGKTSALEVLEGMAPATAGTVRVLGLDPVAGRKHVRPHIGIVLQDGGYPPTATVAEMATTWARTLSTPQPVAQVLDAVDLTSRSAVSIKSLSGGERRRLDLALAILGRPQVLFLDEPTTGLDPESRQRTWQLIRTLVADGTTVVLTTHYLEEAEELADTIAIMHQGRIVREGTAAQIVANEPSRIGFHLTLGGPELPALFGHPRQVGGKVEISTARLQDDLATLLTWASRHELELGALNARAATLEQAFLTIATTQQEVVA